MGITNNIPPSRLIQPGVIDNTAARPASPFEGQAIYQKDTDEVLYYNGTSWTKPWNMPWGQVAYAKRTTTANLTTTNTQILAAPSFTAVSGRIYKATTQVYFQSISTALSSTSYYDLSIYNNATQIHVGDFSAHTAAPYISPILSTYITGASGATVISVYSQMGSGTGQIFANNTNVPMILIVEDMGPA